MQNLTYKTDSDVVKSEPYNRAGRDEVTLLANSGALNPGRIMGSINLGAASSAAKSGGNTGNGTLVLDVTTPILANARDGIYSARFLTTTSIRVEDSKGGFVADIAIGGSTGNTATINEQIKGVVTQGATPFAAGDGFDITIAIGSKKRKPWSPSALDGSQVADSINLETILARTADSKIVVLARGPSEVVVQALEWPGGATDAEKAVALAQLEAKGIVARRGV